jgi:hypothetical protein
VSRKQDRQAGMMAVLGMGYGMKPAATPQPWEFEPRVRIDLWRQDLRRLWPNRATPWVRRECREYISMLRAEQ